MTAPATNPYDYRRIHGAFEVYDTRDGRVLDVCIETGMQALSRCDELWHNELMRQPVAAEKRVLFAWSGVASEWVSGQGAA